MTADGNRQPVRRRVHLLLGQIQLAGADVLVRVELDLLEADDARDDVDLAVGSDGAACPALRTLAALPAPLSAAPAPRDVGCRDPDRVDSNVSRIVTFV